MKRDLLILEVIVTLVLMGLTAVMQLVDAPGITFIVGAIFVFAGVVREYSGRRLPMLGVLVHLVVFLLFVLGGAILYIHLIVVVGMVYLLGRSWTVVRCLGWVAVGMGAVMLIYDLGEQRLIRDFGVVIGLLVVCLRVYDLMWEVGMYWWDRKGLKNKGKAIGNQWPHSDRRGSKG